MTKHILEARRILRESRRNHVEDESLLILLAAYPDMEQYVATVEMELEAERNNAEDDYGD